MFGKDGIAVDLPRSPGGEESRRRRDPTYRARIGSKQQTGNIFKDGKTNESIIGSSNSSRAGFPKTCSASLGISANDKNRIRKNNERSRPRSRERGLEPPSMEVSECVGDEDSLTARRAKLLSSYTNIKRLPDTDVDGGGRSTGHNRTRAYSERKGSNDTKVEDHYGLTMLDKEDLYGRPAAGGNPFESHYKESGLSSSKNGSVPKKFSSQRSELKNERKIHDIEVAQSTNSKDDYSVSVTDVSDPIGKGINNPEKQPDRDVPRSPLVEWRKNLHTPSWFSGFAPGKMLADARSKRMLPRVTKDTNIAPRKRNSSQDWDWNAPRVTFMTEDPSNKKTFGSRWSALSRQTKVAAGLVWVTLMVTLMAVTISEVKSHGSRGVRSEVTGVVVTDLPTLFPTGSPPTIQPTPKLTQRPTLRPTSQPTRPPNASAAVHEKNSYSHSSITGRPTNEPSPRPTTAPTNTHTQIPSQNPTKDCADEQGTFLNHNDNPKNCAWLENRQGVTTRKDKNCGTSLYKITELGMRCPGACTLYNGCSLSSTPSSFTQSTQLLCINDNGSYLNHLMNAKDCVWLENGNLGRTDRKNKNCGADGYDITELGVHCRAACSPYNGC